MNSNIRIYNVPNSQVGGAARRRKSRSSKRSKRSAAPKGLKGLTVVEPTVATVQEPVDVVTTTTAVVEPTEPREARGVPEWVKCTDYDGVCKPPYPTAVKVSDGNVDDDRAINVKSDVVCNVRNFAGYAGNTDNSKCLYQRQDAYVIDMDRGARSHGNVESDVKTLCEVGPAKGAFGQREIRCNLVKEGEKAEGRYVGSIDGKNVKDLAGFANNTISVQKRPDGNGYKICARNTNTHPDQGIWCRETYNAFGKWVVTGWAHHANE